MNNFIILFIGVCVAILIAIIIMFPLYLFINFICYDKSEYCVYSFILWINNFFKNKNIFGCILSMIIVIYLSLSIPLMIIIDTVRAIWKLGIRKETNNGSSIDRS